MRALDTLTGRQRLSLLLLAALIVLGGVLPLFGLPVWFAMIAAPVPWLLYLSRSGLAASLGIVTQVSLWALLATMMATVFIPIPMVDVVAVVWMLAGLLGVWLCTRDPRALRRPSTLAIATLVPTLTGALVWLGTIIVAQFVGGAARLSWVMVGDAANNVNFARDDVYRNGIAVGVGENPVPFPSGILGIIVGSGRASVPSSAALGHDLQAFAQAWTLVIMATCVITGATAAAIVRRTSARPLIVGLVGGGASLLPLSWFFTGYPLEYGFFNGDISLVVLLASFLVYLAGDSRPALTVSVLSLSATVLLATWSPLVLVPGLLALVVVVRSGRRILATRGPERVILVVALVQLVAYGLAVVLPGLIHNGAFLSATGGAYPFRKVMFAGLIVGAGALAFAAFRRIRDLVVLGTAAVALAAVVGLAALLFINRDEPTPWTYYPLKLVWLSSAVLVVLIVGLAPAVLTRYVRVLPVQLAGLLVIAVGTFGFLAWTPSGAVGYVWKNPADRLISGQFYGQGDKLAHRIIALSDLEKPKVLWDTKDKDESAINLWLLLMSSRNTNLHLKYAAYGLLPHHTKNLCNILTWLGPGTTVYTANGSLEGAVDSTCAGSGARFVVTDGTIG